MWPKGRHALLINYTLIFILFFGLFLVFSSSVAKEASTTPTEEEGLKISSKIQVTPSAQDETIRKRIENILTATDWYEKPTVDVKEGVVFLTGKTKTSEHKKWASKLAQNTQDVVAVVNQMEIMGPSAWDIQQMMSTLNEQWRLALRALPFLGFALIVLAFTFPVSRLFSKYTRKSLRRRGLHPLLSEVRDLKFNKLPIMFGREIAFCEDAHHGVRSFSSLT